MAIPRYCKVCQDTIPGKDHHCVWIDACISQANMAHFLGFLAFLDLALINAGLIMITSVCLPLDMIKNTIVIPKNWWCHSWNNHFSGNERVTFTAGIHCIVLGIVISLLFFAKLFSHLTVVYQRRKHA